MDIRARPKETSGYKVILLYRYPHRFTFPPTRLIGDSLDGLSLGERKSEECRRNGAEVKKRGKE